jgi:biotin carboxyl carrier protein
MRFQIKIDKVLYQVEVGDVLSRPIEVQVDGVTFEVWPEESQTSAAPAAFVSSISALSQPEPARAAEVKARPAPTHGGHKPVTAPMPGLISAISAQAGDVVTAGTQLAVLEAMKMKNKIRATQAGTISAVRVSPGDPVKKGQILVEFTDKD